VLHRRAPLPTLKTKPIAQPKRKRTAPDAEDFRQVVDRSAGGRVLATTATFHLHDIVNQTETVKAPLAE